MADIELVIKIPEHCLEGLRHIELNESNEGIVFHAIRCIMQGTPLPKGHGRLIDVSQLATITNIDGCPLVEIITCKDCKYYRNKGNKHSYCTKRLNVDSITDRYREPDYYCADAERR